MLSILAKSFMVAAQTDARPETKKRQWLPENHWWKENKSAQRSDQK